MIQAKGIEKSFGALKVLKGIDFSVEKSEVVSIMGASGAGKSTLLQILGTLSTPDGGSLIIDGVDVLRLKGDALAEFRNRRIGFVFQFHHLLPEFTALENVMIPAFIAGRSKKEAQQREAELNAKVEATRRRAKESSAYAQAQQKEMAAALKSTQAALEEAQKARDDALKQQRMAQQKAEEAAAALEEAKRRAEENKFTKKFLEAVSLRREDKNKQNKDSE